MSTKTGMTEIRLTAWSEFVAQAEALDGWAFRGQQRSAWPLESSLARWLDAFCPDTSLWPLREEHALRIFRRKANSTCVNAVSWKTSCAVWR